MTVVGTDRADRPPEPAGLPVILGIALDDVTRKRLATLLNGVGVLMFTPDVATAHAMLCRDEEPERKDIDELPGDSVVRAGDLEVDGIRCRATWRGVPLALTKRERDLLACLAAEPGRVWTYRQLSDAAWDVAYLDSGPVHAAVKRLRRRLRDTGVPVRIEAVRGVGYQLAIDESQSA